MLHLNDRIEQREEEMGPGNRKANTAGRGIPLDNEEGCHRVATIQRAAGQERAEDGEFLKTCLQGGNKQKINKSLNNSECIERFIVLSRKPEGKLVIGNCRTK